MNCKYCNQDYPEKFFHVAATINGKTYRRKKCKFCYTKTKAILRSKVRDEVNTYKAAQGCCNCPVKDFRALDFHHPNNDKEFDIGNWILRSSRKKIWKEIKKCVVICANCHRILHWEEKRG